MSGENPGKGNVSSFVERLPVPAPQRPAHRFKSLAEIREKLTGPQYLTKPILERDILAVMFGESGTFKSFVAVDLGLSVAYGEEFHGYKVKAGTVVYIVGEGHGGIGRRAEVWLIDHELTGIDAPFFVSELPAQLINEGDAMAIADVITRICDERDIGMPVLIIIDTLSTNIGDGDENSNPDIARLLTNVNVHLRARFNACVLIVHHTGHGDKDRERGAYAIRGNVDARIQVKAETGGCISLHSLKVKDGPRFETLAFRTKVITIPELFDSEGEPVTSLVLERIDYLDPAVVKALPAQLDQALAVLKDMYQTAQDNLKAGGYDPAGVRVEARAWKDRLREMRVVKKDATRKALDNIRSRLIREGLISQYGIHVYPVLTAGEIEAATDD